MGSFMGGRGTANLLTRSTAILGAAFFALALTLALLTKGVSQQNRSILDGPAPITAPGTPALPTLPSVPTN
jgi:preprotein translocase subunit SecG